MTQLLGHRRSQNVVLGTGSRHVFISLPGFYRVSSRRHISNCSVGRRRHQRRAHEFALNNQRLFCKKKRQKKTIPFGNQSSLIKADQSNRAESNESRGHKKEEKGNRVWTGAGFTNVIERQSRSDGRPMGSLRSRVTRPHPAPRPLIRLVGRLDANVVEWRRPDAPRPQSPFRLHHNTAKKTR